VGAASRQGRTGERRADRKRGREKGREGRKGREEERGEIMGPTGCFVGAETH